jgi:hypothetical protein
MRSPEFPTRNLPKCDPVHTRLRRSLVNRNPNTPEGPHQHGGPKDVSGNGDQADQSRSAAKLYWEDARMTQLLNSFIPAEFLEAWARGQYVIGPRTVDYQYAGLALMLRGFYRYDVLDVRDKKPLFGGYAVAAILDKELTFAGFRVYASDTIQGAQTPMFWKSVFSKFIDNKYNSGADLAAQCYNSSNTELYFPYYIFLQKMDYLNRQTRTSINSFTAACKTKDNLDTLETKIMRTDDISPDDKASDTRPCQLLGILSELFEHAGNPAGQPTLQGLCMFDSIPVSRPRQRNMANTFELELTGQNYGVVGQAIQGTVTFRRLSEGFLDTLERRAESQRQKGDAV